MKPLVSLLIFLFSLGAFGKNYGLSYNATIGAGVLEYQLYPNRTIGFWYGSRRYSEETYDYDGTGYGLSVSTKDFTDTASLDFFLFRMDVGRMECPACISESMINYSWGFNIQKNWVWDWGLYIYIGLGFNYQHKTYNFRGDSFVGPLIYVPLGAGFAF